MTALFLTVYIVIALICVGLSWYLSYPGHTMLTLPGDALKLLPRRSQPAPVESPASAEPKRPSFFEELSHSETQHDQVAPPVAPASDEGHEEAAPVEVVHDEP